MGFVELNSVYSPSDLSNRVKSSHFTVSVFSFKDFGKPSETEKWYHLISLAGNTNIKTENESEKCLVWFSTVTGKLILRKAWVISFVYEDVQILEISY